LTNLDIVSLRGDDVTADVIKITTDKDEHFIKSFPEGKT